MMLGYSLFGITPFAARFFSALMGVLTVLSIFWFGKRYLGEKTAFFSSLIYLSSFLVAGQFHLAVPDPYLIFLVTLSGLLIYSYMKERKLVLLILSYVLMGLAFMAKGPIGLLLPAFGYLIFMIGSEKPSWKVITLLKPWLGIGIVALIAFPWYYLVFQATDGEWVREFFFKHNVGRYTSSMEGHGGFPLAALAIGLVALFPAGLFVFHGIGKAWKERKEQSMVYFSLSMAAGVLIFFSFSKTILPSYISPALPFLSIVVGNYFATATSFKNWKPVLWIIILLTIAVPIIAWIIISADPVLSSSKDFMLLLLFLPFGAAFGYYFFLKRKKDQMVFSLAIGGILASFMFMQFTYPAFDQNNPVRLSISMIRESGLPVVQYKRMNQSYMFYLKTPIPRLQEPVQIDSLLEMKKPVMIISRNDKAEYLERNRKLERIFEGQDLFEKRKTVIYRTRME
jgi:4-amino-4-deoxy-L-arabinose transferase-like glycosyltransferase